MKKPTWHSLSPLLFRLLFTSAIGVALTGIAMGDDKDSTLNDSDIVSDQDVGPMGLDGYDPSAAFVNDRGEDERGLNFEDAQPGNITVPAPAAKKTKPRLNKAIKKKPTAKPLKSKKQTQQTRKRQDKWVSNSSPRKQGTSLRAMSLDAAKKSTETSTSTPTQAEATPPAGPVVIEKLGLTVNPPQGWEVQTNSPSLTLIMQEPEAKKVEYDVAQYRRNITLATLPDAQPIDKVRLEQLLVELKERFGKGASVKDFRVVESKFFDHRSKNDGILVYTQFEMGEFSLMQVHALMGNDKNQFLMTYTDLAERFSKPETFDVAWQTMAGMQFEGTAPVRYQDTVIFGGIAFVLCFIVLIAAYLRQRSARLEYESAADDVYRDDHGVGSAQPLTQSMVWNLKSSDNGPQDGAFMKTQMSEVSNF